jgi:hypothetical protein
MYDSVNRTSPYFAVFLWFSELLPIIFISVLIQAKEFHVYRLVFERVGKRRRDYDYLEESDNETSFFLNVTSLFDSKKLHDDSLASLNEVAEISDEGE